MKVGEFIDRIQHPGCECDVRVVDDSGHEEAIILVDGSSVTFRQFLPGVEKYLGRLVGKIQLDRGCITLHLKKPRKGTGKG